MGPAEIAEIAERRIAGDSIKFPPFPPFLRDIKKIAYRREIEQKLLEDKTMAKNTFSYYCTNHPNLLGGPMCYDSFERARRACEGGWGTQIYLRTMVRRDNNIGIEVNGSLCKELWCDLIWEKKN